MQKSKLVTFIHSNFISNLFKKISRDSKQFLQNYLKTTKMNKTRIFFQFSKVSARKAAQKLEALDLPSCVFFEKKHRKV